MIPLHYAWRPLAALLLSVPRASTSSTPQFGAFWLSVLAALVVAVGPPHAFISVAFSLPYTAACCRLSCSALFSVDDYRTLHFLWTLIFRAFSISSKTFLTVPPPTIPSCSLPIIFLQREASVVWLLASRQLVNFVRYYFCNLDKFFR